MTSIHLESAVMQPDSPDRPVWRDGAPARTLAAARQLFAQKGYRATKTKEICVLAGIAEPTLYRHFGSKAHLFEMTVLEPFTEFIDGWITSWREFSAESSIQDLAESLVRGLYTLVRQDRSLFQELMDARADRKNDLHGSAVAISTRIREGLRAVQEVGLEIADERHLTHLDPSATITSVAAMVIGAVMLEDWIVPAGVRRPSQDRMIQEMTMMVAHGITGRPS
jgi:AcrR family transcriptional regulator